MYSPQVLSILLHPVHDAPLPLPVQIQAHHGYMFRWGILSAGASRRHRKFFPPRHILESVQEIPSFGYMLSPVKFSAQDHSTSELLRTL